LKKGDEGGFEFFFKGLNYYEKPFHWAVGARGIVPLPINRDWRFTNRPYRRNPFFFSSGLGDPAGRPYKRPVRLWLGQVWAPEKHGGLIQKVLDSPEGSSHI
jgi:hypothetical protein